jgi:hypothetical protein
MSYKIDWQSNNAEGIAGKQPITLANKTLNSTSTSLTLTGRGIPNYGEIQQENFLRLMENFSSGLPPANPTIGQIWFNPIETILYMRVDPAAIGNMHPLYHPQSPPAWVQIWPSVTTHAGVGEFNMLAIEFNRILGLPTADSALPDDQFGWGQTDLVPVYANINTLAPGFSPTVYPPVFDNEAWVILLSRLRKALRHIGQPENLTPPVGMINDGRPFGAGSVLGNAFNNYPAAGSLPNYTSGWNGLGTASMQIFYNNIISAIATLKLNRFKMAPISSEFSSSIARSRTTPWASTISHQINLTFATQDAAKTYFNAGGHVRFDWSLTPNVVNMLNTSWQNFLAAQTNLIFDFKSMRHGAVREHANTIASQYIGFYNLTTTSQEIYQRDRQFGGNGPYSAYGSISDGGIKIDAFVSTAVDGKFTVHFNVQFVEGLAPGETVSGTTLSGVWSHKPNSINTNSPLVSYPTATDAGSF